MKDLKEIRLVVSYDKEEKELVCDSVTVPKDLGAEYWHIGALLQQIGKDFVDGPEALLVMDES